MVISGKAMTSRSLPKQVLFLGVVLAAFLQATQLISHLNPVHDSGIETLPRERDLRVAEFQEKLLGAPEASWVKASSIGPKLLWQWGKLVPNTNVKISFALPRRTTIPRTSVTVAVHGGADRFHRLLFSILRWNGPTSAAVYLSNPDDINKFVGFYDRNWHSLHMADFHLVLEKLNPDEPLPYPHNVLRELALNNVKSDYFLALDVDFVTQTNASRALRKLIRTDSSLKKALHNRTLMVLPAFNRNLKQEDLVNESNVFEIGTKRLPENKDRVKRACQLGAMEPFHVFKFWEGHGPVNFAHWLGVDNATTSNGSYYDIIYETGFEPYVLGYRRNSDIPHYWEGFRGFGINKYSWFVEANLTGFKFGVLSDFFVTHLDHDYGPGGHKKITEDTYEKLQQFIAYLEKHYKDTSSFLVYLKHKHPSWFDDSYFLSDGPTKYLQYAIQSSFKEQIRCAERAYYIARATHRTMILAPVLSQTSLTAGTFFNIKEGVFRTDVDLLRLYTPPSDSWRYVPLEEVIDTKFTFPDVETIDFRAFHQNASSSSMSTWVVESQYHHFNTYWMRNRPDLEDAYEEYEKVEYGVTRFISATFRDVGQIAQTHPEDVWTFLDSFKMIKHHSLRPKRPFEIRYSHRIRQISKQIHDEIWGALPYASAYFDNRGLVSGNREATIQHVNQTLGSVLSQMVTWFEDDASQNAKHVGLFVATDHINTKDPSMEILREHLDFLRSVMRTSYDSTLQVWFSDSFASYKATDQWKAMEERLGYPDAFLDQQLTACGVIGFAGSTDATAGSLIEHLRMSGEAAC